MIAALHMLDLWQWLLDDWAFDLISKSSRSSER